MASIPASASRVAYRIRCVGKCDGRFAGDRGFSLSWIIGRNTFARALRDVVSHEGDEPRTVSLRAMPTLPNRMPPDRAR